MRVFTDVTRIVWLGGTRRMALDKQCTGCRFNPRPILHYRLILCKLLADVAMLAKQYNLFPAKSSNDVSLGR